MTPEETQERNLVVKIAQEYVGTPYHTGGRVKQSGVDCLTILACVFEESKLLANIEIPPYPSDWHLHRNEERYLTGLMRYAPNEKIGSPLPGDIVIWKFGRCFSHGAIVVKWPIVVHAYVNRKVSLENAEQSQWLKFIGEGKDRGKPRPMKIFSYWR